MTINGANNPYETANMVKRHNENTMVQMARNAKSIVS